MKAIGGFFELELGTPAYEYHGDAVAMSCGRACLNLILQEERPKHVYLPFYACDAVLEPFQASGIPYTYYKLDQNMQIKDLPSLGRDEMLLVINYFGLQGKYIRKLAGEFGNRLIIDNTQAFFEKRIQKSWAFNSARKFFGVPDGGYLYPVKPVRRDFDRNDEVKVDHLIHRLIGKQEQAYSEFLKSEQDFSPTIMGMNKVSQHILSTLDYHGAVRARKENFERYHSAFDSMNQLEFDQHEIDVPMAYPLMLEKRVDLSAFYRKGIFIPVLWKEVLERETGNQSFEQEERFTTHILPLPVDHRYRPADCEIVITNILKNQAAVA